MIKLIKFAFYTIATLRLPIFLFGYLIYYLSILLLKLSYFLTDNHMNRTEEEIEERLNILRTTYYG